MASNVYVDIDEISEFSTNIKTTANNMNIILDDLITMTMDMEKFFDTPTAKIMKESLITFLKDSKITCNQLECIGENVNKSNNIYKQAISNMSNSVRG